MNILVTGGYGFVGSFVAERFFKEGHKVFILDNLSTGSKDNVNFKHKFFEMDVKDERCDEIFKINNFDVVVHLAAHNDITASCENPHEDAMSNIIGLINMLSLSKKYDVQRFIFMSSASVYEESSSLPIKETHTVKPATPHAAGKLLGEEYCRIFNELHGLNTVVLRASNIYGPRQGMTDEGGVISKFIISALSEDTLYIYGDGNQTRDFIYIEDVAYAVFKCVESDYCGVMNLSTKRETSIDTVVDILSSLTELKKVEKVSPRNYDVHRLCLDNALIKWELDWVPIYSVEEGISKTFEWYKANYRKQEKPVADVEKTNEPGKVLKFFKALLPYIENLMLFGAVAFIDYYAPSMGDHFFIDTKLAYIVLIGVVYGSKHSFIAVFLSSVLYVLEGFNEGKDILSIFYDSDGLIRVAYYLFIGFFVGYAIDIRNRNVKNHIHKYEAAKEKLDFLSVVYNETKLVKDELKKQIRMSEDSLSKVYSIIKELDTLSPEKVYNSAVQVLERVMKSKGIAIYILGRNGYFARLVANSSGISSNVSKSKRIDDNPELKAIIETREVYINKSFDPEMPMMMAPVEDGGNVLALLAIYDVEFENISLYYQNLLKIVANFIASSLTKAIRYQDAIYSERYVQGTNVLKPESFREVLQSKNQATENDFSSYVLLRVESKYDLQEVDQKVSSSIREIDYVGLSEDKMVYVLLSNTKEEEAKFVVKRLSEKGVAVSIESGDGLVA